MYLKLLIAKTIQQVDRQACLFLNHFNHEFFGRTRKKTLVHSLGLGLSLVLSGTVVAGEAPEVTKVTIEGKELLALGFEKLSAFEYTVIDAGTGASEAEIAAAKKRDQLPSWVHSYEGKRVALTGYMLPLLLEDGLTKKFIMMKDVSTCCYGAAPKMNDYVVVTMKSGGVAALQDIPVVLVGVFHASEQYENGMVVSLFQMDGEKFVGPKK